MKYEVTYMERPKLVFEQIDVITPDGDAFIAGPHRWEPIVVAFANADEVYEYHVALGGGYFDIDFTSLGERWVLTQCLVTARMIPSTDRFVVTYQHARQVIVGDE
jgi:hypothetical protein